MQKIYPVKHPKIHLSEVIGYDVKNKIYYISNKSDIIFDTKDELIDFLARANEPVVNFDGKTIKGKFRNKYMDNQALNGISRRCPYLTTDWASEIDRFWKVNDFLFWLDTPERPNIDVRLFKEEVNAVYTAKYQSNNSYLFFRYKKSRKMSQGRTSHKCYPMRNDARYIQRARQAYGMEAEDEYKFFVKAKDKKYRSIWPDEDFGGYHSTGWKDNAGNRYRHQWEAKEQRNFEKIKKKKEICC